MNNIIPDRIGNEAYEFLYTNGEMRNAFSIKIYNTNKEWLAGRKKTIGASEASAILGCNPWMTVDQLWREKTTDKVKVENSSTDCIRGHYSESHIRELWAIETGQKVYDGTHIILKSKAHPFMSCTLDGIIVDNEGVPSILEIKSIRNGHGNWGEDTIPQYYLCQVLHQLAVTNWNDAILLARFARNPDYEDAREKAYHISRADYEDDIVKLIQKEAKFWNENVIGNKKPSVKCPTI